MNNLFKYSIYNMLNEYKKNEPVLVAWMKGQTVEKYADDKPATKEDKAILGLGLGIFMMLLVINLILWIWAIVALIQKWNIMPTWAQVISLIFILIGGPLISIIVTYLSVAGNSKMKYRFY